MQGPGCLLTCNHLRNEPCCFGTDPAVEQFIEIGGSLGPSCLFPVLELVADMGYVCGSTCMCGGSSINPAIATLQLFLQSREKEAICFSCQKQVEPVLGGGGG